jgi:hypothetical protein
MGRARLLLLPLLIAVLWLLVPLAYASPPDPTHVPGLWDDADYDDVVILATSSSGATDWHTHNDLTWPLVVIALISPARDGLFPTAMSTPHTTRSPPTNLI